MDEWLEMDYEDRFYTDDLEDWELHQLGLDRISGEYDTNWDDE